MARKSRKNIPSVMAETECSLPVGTETKTSGNSVVQISADWESMATVYHAAIYARLSYETEANRERDTVETQIAYLKNFIDRQEDIELADVYAEM